MKAHDALQEQHRESFPAIRVPVRAVIELDMRLRPNAESVDGPPGPSRR